jgi:hypothetical protein
MRRARGALTVTTVDSVDILKIPYGGEAKGVSIATIGRWDGSLAVCLPAELATALCLREGERLDGNRSRPDRHAPGQATI